MPFVLYASGHSNWGCCDPPNHLKIFLVPLRGREREKAAPRSSGCFSAGDWRAIFSLTIGPSMVWSGGRGIPADSRQTSLWLEISSSCN